MFSIINTGLANILVWFSPGAQTVSTPVPHSPRAVSSSAAAPARSPLSRWREHRAELSPKAGAASHTSASSDAHESSHTQEFTIA